MTDYYVTGRGKTAHGPYNLEQARMVGAILAVKHDLQGILILSTFETARPATGAYNDGETYEGFVSRYEAMDEEQVEKWDPT